MAAGISNSGKIFVRRGQTQAGMTGREHSSRPLVREHHQPGVQHDLEQDSVCEIHAAAQAG